MNMKLLSVVTPPSIYHITIFNTYWRKCAFHRHNITQNNKNQHKKAQKCFHFTIKIPTLKKWWYHNTTRFSYITCKYDKSFKPHQPQYIYSGSSLFSRDWVCLKLSMEKVPSLLACVMEFPPLHISRVWTFIFLHTSSSTILLQGSDLLNTWKINNDH